MIERKLQYNMRQAKHKQPFNTEAIVVKIQNYRCKPYYADDNCLCNRNTVPVNNAGFTEPVDVMIGVSESNQPC